jgi:UDP-N-acetylglucosamine:LPS N-acetylglucosamine transferase
MGRWASVGAVVALATLVAVPAIAADKNAKKGPTLRWAHKYADAIAEAHERNCVLYVTIHAEH